MGEILKENRSESWTLLRPEAYSQELRNEIGRTKPGDSIKIQIMLLEAGYPVKPIQLLLMDAAKRGVQVKLHVDEFSRRVIRGLPDYFVIPTKPLLPEARKQRQENETMYQELRDSGVRLIFTNPSRGIKEKLLPQAGRDHRKVVIIKRAHGETVAYFGGMNLERAFPRPDFMVKITDSQIISVLEEEFGKINENRPKQDYERKLDDETSLLVDCGLYGTSIILDRVVDLANRASNGDTILCTTQFTPDGKMQDALHQAHERGVEVKVVISSSSVGDATVRILDWQNQRRMKREKAFFPLYRSPDWIHSKLFIVENASGERVVVFGSHNFLESGVSARTIESSLQSTNKHLASQVKDFFDWLLEKAAPATDLRGRTHDTSEV